MSTERIRIHCHDCNKETRHEICQEVKAAPPPGPANGTPAKTYQIVQCGGCETVSFRELIPSASETTENLYPPRMIRHPKNYNTSRAPGEIVGIYQATMSAFNAGASNTSSFILCGGGIRCMLELICADLGVTGSSLENKITGLQRAGHLTETYVLHLQDARFLGNEALHEGEVPKQDKLDELLTLFEDAIYALYVQPERFLQGDLLPGAVVKVREDGVEVRVGKSTRSLIALGELGLEAGHSPAAAFRDGQRITVKVVSGRDEPLRLSKKDADADGKRDEEARLRKVEADRARREALRRLKPGEILDGVVTKVFHDGIWAKVNLDKVEVEGWIPRAGVESRDPRPHQRISAVVTEVRHQEDVLELSERMVPKEKSYRRAEEAFRLKTILECRVMEPTRDGSKVRVHVSHSCEGFVHQNQLGEAEGENLEEWKDRRIPVRVISPPDPLRALPLLLSHRAALNRLKALEGFQQSDRLTGRVGKYVQEGVLVSVGRAPGVEGLVPKADLASRPLRTDDEVQVEVAKLDMRRGVLELRYLPADGMPVPAAGETDHEMSDDDFSGSKSEGGYAEPPDPSPDEAAAHGSPGAVSTAGVPTPATDPPPAGDLSGVAKAESGSPTLETAPLPGQAAGAKAPPGGPTEKGVLPGEPLSDKSLSMITCTTCQTNLRVKSEHAGKRVKCPKCGQVIPVPEHQPR